MTERLRILEEIREDVKKDPKDVPREKRKRFWKLVREIKREPHPDDAEILVAAEIRDILFDVDRGKTYRTGPSMLIMTIVGLGPLLAYFWLLETPLDWTNLLAWSPLDAWNLIFRCLAVLGVVALFYPWGRFISARVLGIRIMGMCQDHIHEPTLRIDYVTFLKTRPDRRKWFFFFGGLWTAITSIIVGLLGFFYAGDLSGFIPAILILLFEGKVIASGSASMSSGEMGHFNRERKIERAWRKKLEENTQLS
ncbi:MAG: hypothetical protein ACXAEF_10785 [Candidatus Thorarchaeota archaeon]